MSKKQSTALVILSLLSLLSVVLILTPTTPAAAQADFQSATPTPDPFSGTPADFEVPFGQSLAAFSGLGCLCCLGGAIPLVVIFFVLIMYLTKLEKD